MAFNAEQTKRARAVIVILLLVAVIALAVVVLSGALTPAGSQGRQASQQSEQMDGNASSSSQAASDDAHTMDDVDATYGTSAKQLKAKYEANPADPSTLLNLANGYFDWGTAAMSHAQGDEDQQHAIDLFKQAISYYDTYIEHNPGSKSTARSASSTRATIPRPSRRLRSLWPPIPRLDPPGQTLVCSTRTRAASMTPRTPTTRRSRLIPRTPTRSRRMPSSVWLTLNPPKATLRSAALAPGILLTLRVQGASTWSW